MKRCKACGREYRKSTFALVLFPDGARIARVCSECVRRAVLVVAPTAPRVVKQEVVRAEGVDRAIRMLRTYASAARESGRTSNEEERSRGFFNGRAEGIEAAIETIKRETSK